MFYKHVCNAHLHKFYKCKTHFTFINKVKKVKARNLSNSQGATCKKKIS